MQYSKNHAKYISDTIREYVFNKYQQGQEEHGGNLERKELLSHSIEEAADLMVYLMTKRDQEAWLAEKIRQVLDALDENMPQAARNRAREAYNLLTIGNPEGIEEEEHET